MDYSTIYIQILNGITLILVMAMVAIGLAVIFGLMGVINLAHGDLFMLGAYTIVVTDRVGLPFWAGLTLAPIAVGLIGYLVEIMLIRFLYKRPLETLLATWGLSLLIEQVIKIIFSTRFQPIKAYMAGTVQFFGLPFPLYRLFIIGFSIVVILTTFWILRRTTFGIEIVAVVQSPEMASALGINTPRIYSLGFAYGSALAGLSGAVMAPLLTVEPLIGLWFMIRSFLVVIVGGVGKLLGILFGAAIIGGTETVMGYFTSSMIAQAMVFLMAIIIIRLKPKGIIV